MPGSVIALSSQLLNFVRTGIGNNHPVILLHAVGLDLTMWGPQIAILRETQDVIAFDLPGHGLSPKLTGDPTFENFAAVISEAIERLDRGPVNLVGISFGGMIAQTISILRPDLVRSLVLIGTACTFPPEVRNALKARAEYVRTEGMQAIAPLSLARWFTAAFALRRPDILDNIKKMLYQQDNHFHAALWDTIANLETESALREISVPALVITGKEDTSTPVSSAKALAQALKTENMAIIPNASHLASLEAPEVVNNLLLKFYSEIDS